MKPREATFDAAGAYVPEADLDRKMMLEKRNRGSLTLPALADLSRLEIRLECLCCLLLRTSARTHARRLAGNVSGIVLQL